jgi:hypothetical protein
MQDRKEQQLDELVDWAAEASEGSPSNKPHPLYQNTTHGADAQPFTTTMEESKLSKYFVWGLSTVASSILAYTSVPLLATYHFEGSPTVA